VILRERFLRTSLKIYREEIEKDVFIDMYIETNKKLGEGSFGTVFQVKKASDQKYSIKKKISLF
jgi:hypothetical protein